MSEGIGGLTSIEPAGTSRRRRRPASHRRTPIAPEVQPLPIWQIVVRVVIVLAVAMAVSSLCLWLGITYTGGADAAEGAVNAGTLTQFVLATAGALFGSFVLPALITVLAARFHMRRSRRTAWLVASVLYLALTLLTVLAGLVALGSGLIGQGLRLALPGLLAVAVLTIPPAPWLVRPVRRAGGSRPSRG
ncbi:hypothetical protein ACSDQ9_03810 [Aestuariimicrobium soli]|uniref:hypothetical protein n=1 Tax=Aestuariimicrobium soli TaxID=2035834 RepID=UPI003EBF7BFD